jgi:hypothetical protein
MNPIILNYFFGLLINFLILFGSNCITLSTKMVHSVNFIQETVISAQGGNIRFLFIHFHQYIQHKPIITFFKQSNLISILFYLFFFFSNFTYNPNSFLKLSVLSKYFKPNRKSFESRLSEPDRPVGPIEPGIGPASGPSQP